MLPLEVSFIMLVGSEALSGDPLHIERGYHFRAISYSSEPTEEALGWTGASFSKFLEREAP